MGVLSAFFKGRCPHCREGKVFKHPVTRVKKFKQMHTHCSVCGVKYEQEPGFFWGAMYFSYALNVALFLTAGILFYTFSETNDEDVFMIILVSITVVAIPITFRTSRLLMMYFAAPYRRYRGGKR